MTMHMSAAIYAHDYVLNSEDFGNADDRTTVNYLKVLSSCLF